ncbi:MAG: hypothetical protein BWY26_00406 [Elusimicrobia bacterium ADurb.Bin231]|nr:MAG: hypothetical protein BWY26_00406 [Elusimicrobia bacterium ADurb.Bin231]
MLFINPAFLIGLLGISFPIIMHLLSKKKPRLLEFGDIRLLSAAARMSVKKFRLRQYLLLITRCFIIAAATFLFSKPVMHYGSFHDKTVNVILIDNSYSMGYLYEGKTRLESACSAALKVLEMLKPYEKVAVFSFSDLLAPVIKNPTSDRSLISSEISGIKISSRKTDVVAAISRLDEYFSSSGVNLRVIVITDFAKNGWQGNIGSPVPGKCDFICIDVGAATPENFAVSRAEQAESENNVGVVNYSINKKRISLSLNVSGKNYKTLLIDSVSGMEKIYSVQPSNIPSGIHICYWELEPDKLPFDNRRYFVYNSVGKPRVLLIDGNPQFSDFNSEVYFIKTAIKDYAAFTVMNPAQLANENFSKYDFIFMCNVPELARNVLAGINDFVAAGKSVILFPGDNISVDKYNSVFRFLLPCEISAAVDGSMPVSAYKNTGISELLSDIKIAKRFILQPVSSAETLMKFVDDSPFLVRGANNVYVFAVSSNLSFSNFPIKSIFPVVLKDIFAAASGSGISVKYMVSGDTTAANGYPDITEVLSHDGKKPVLSGNNLPEEPGVYQVKLKGGKKEFFVINPDVLSGESDISRIPDQDIKRSFGGIFYRVIKADSRFEHSLKKVLYGNEITHILAWCLLFLIILETILVYAVRG